MYFSSILSDFEPTDEQMNEVSDVENNADSDDEDFDNLLTELRSSDQKRPSTDSDTSSTKVKNARLSANDFVKAINEESEPESDEELRDALRQADKNNEDNMG